MNGTRLRWTDIPGPLRSRAEAAVGTPLHEIASAPGGFTPGVASAAPAVRDFQRAQATALLAWLTTRCPGLLDDRT
ncbi:hypothetical protein [Actinoplanes philippinensis]|uniref:hypothetical protein n=1 Tax=Actinoplanes philippinensis TaxID=35752 RepID=UPI0033FDC83C